jgi:hypothetical protein
MNEVIAGSAKRTLLRSRAREKLPGGPRSALATNRLPTRLTSFRVKGKTVDRTPRDPSPRPGGVAQISAEPRSPLIESEKQPRNSDERGPKEAGNKPGIGPKEAGNKPETDPKER